MDVAQDDLERLRRTMHQTLDKNDLEQLRQALRQAFEHFWSEGGAVVGIQDTHFPGLVVPESVRNRYPLILRYDQEPIIPIPDLELEPLGIRATLSFDRSPFPTFVPWEAIVAVGSSREQETEPPHQRPRLSLVP